MGRGQRRKTCDEKQTVLVFVLVFAKLQRGLPRKQAIQDFEKMEGAALSTSNFESGKSFQPSESTFPFSLLTPSFETLSLAIYLKSLHWILAHNVRSGTLRWALDSSFWSLHFFWSQNLLVMPILRYCRPGRLLAMIMVLLVVLVLTFITYREMFSANPKHGINAGIDDGSLRKRNTITLDMPWEYASSLLSHS